MYDTKYYPIWISKYRKKTFNRGIAEEFKFEIYNMEVTKDHVYVFLSDPPRYSPAQIVQIMKSISAKQVFRKFPPLQDVLWNRELWRDRRNNPKVYPVSAQSRPTKA